MEASPPSPARHRGGLTFPVLLMALGVIFLADHVVPGWGLHKTWPAVLIVLGICKLVDATRAPRPPEGPRVGKR